MARNVLNLSSSELERLKKGEVVVKTLQEKSYAVQLDPAINELRKIRTDHINIPDRLANSSLSAKQNSELLRGKVVSLRDQSGSPVSLKIDLLNPRGFSAMSTL